MRWWLGAAGPSRNCGPAGLFGKARCGSGLGAFVSPPREPFVTAAQLPTRNSSGCAAASGVAFCLGGFDGPDLSLGVGVARSRAVEAVPRSSGAFVQRQLQSL